MSRTLAISATFAILGAVAMSVDVPLSRAMLEGKLLRPLRGLFESIEPFGQPTAILMTAGAIALCDPRRRPLTPRLLAAALGAGLAADIVKLLVARARPHHGDLTGSAWNTFQGLLPGLGIGSTMQSCPSAHTATAVGFCLALGTMFPAGRWLFLAGVVGVALQRIESGAHFLSDVCWGAAVGYLWSAVVFRPDLLGGGFDRAERVWAGARLPAEQATSRRLPIVAED